MTPNTTTHPLALAHGRREAPRVPQPALGGEREHEADAREAASCNEERLEDVRADVGDVRDRAVLRDVVGAAGGEPLRGVVRSCAHKYKDYGRAP